MGSKILVLLTLLNIPFTGEEILAGSGHLMISIFIVARWVGEFLVFSPVQIIVSPYIFPQRNTYTNTPGPWFKEHSDGWGSSCSYRKVLLCDRLNHSFVNSTSLNEANIAASDLVVWSHFLRLTHSFSLTLFFLRRSHTSTSLWSTSTVTQVNLDRFPRQYFVLSYWQFHSNIYVLSLFFHIL